MACLAMALLVYRRPAPPVFRSGSATGREIAPFGGGRRAQLHTLQALGARALLLLTTFRSIVIAIKAILLLQHMDA
jgi:hypothetical protein